MTVSKQSWIGDVDGKTTAELVPSVCDSFSQFPFMLHNKLVMQHNTTTGNIECVTQMNEHLVGNVLYGILHGGVTATMLDSIGGLQTMIELFHQLETENCNKNFDSSDYKYIGVKELQAQVIEKVSRVATTDFRVDYLSAGKGSYFVATAEVMRLGSRHSTCQMKLVNEEGKLIAVATGSYAY